MWLKTTPKAEYSRRKAGLHSKAQINGFWLGSTSSVQMNRRTFTEKHCVAICTATAILLTQQAHVIIFNYKLMPRFERHSFSWMDSVISSRRPLPPSFCYLSNLTSLPVKLAQVGTSLTCITSARVFKNAVLKETMADILTFEKVAHLTLHNNFIWNPI